eukprot:1073118-Pleurochrysis_carterae.AAC.1
MYAHFFSVHCTLHRPPVSATPASFLSITCVFALDCPGILLFLPFPLPPPPNLARLGPHQPTR